MCRDTACRVNSVFLEISHGHGTPCPYESRYIPIIFLKIDLCVENLTATAFTFFNYL